MPIKRYVVCIGEYNDNGDDLTVVQNIRDIAENIKEHIEEQLGVNVNIEEEKYEINLTFEMHK